MSNIRYDETLRKKILRLHLEEGRTIRSLTAEYSLGKSTISNWLKKHREECETNPEIQSETDSMLEVQKLKKRIEELEKENRFLKKVAAFFAKETE